MEGFSETGISRALDPRVGLRFWQRFQVRLAGYLLALTFASSAVAGWIYYSRQMKFVEDEQVKRGATLISNLAGQSELGAYSGESTFLFGPVRRAFQETDVNFAVIYGRKGDPLIKMTKPGVDVDLSLPPTRLATLLSAPSHPPLRLPGRGYDDLLAPITTVEDDPEVGLFGAQAGGRASVTIGVARIGLSHVPAQQKLDEVLRWGIYLSLIVLAMGVLIALVLARRISRPVLDLARGADEVRRGALGYQLPLRRADELGLLAESFNRMSSQLRHTVDSLAHLNRNLEQEVSARTADLRRSRDFVVLLNAPLQLDKLLDSALSAVIGQTGAEAGALLLQTPRGLDLVVSHGAHADAFRDRTDPPATWLTDASRRERPLVVDPLPAGLALRDGCPDARILLVVPVRFREQLEAVLLLGLRAPPAPDLVDFVGHAGSELAIAVANARALAAAERLAQELERRNVALLQQMDQLQEVSRLKSEFLTNISHELRTPLNAIIGYTELLADGIYGAVSPDQARSLSGIAENARNLLDLIDQILDLSKVEAGRMKVQLREVDINQLVHDVVDLSKPLTKDRPYTVSSELPAAPLRAKTDPTLVRQILINLVSNAIKFTRAGSVQIEARGDDSREVRIAVRDTGIGIRPEHLSLIFDEFRQIDGSSTREFGGTGLGLAISKKLAALLSGDILVESVHGQGSTFTLVLRQARIRPTSADELPVVTVATGDTNAR